MKKIWTKKKDKTCEYHAPTDKRIQQSERTERNRFNRIAKSVDGDKLRAFKASMCMDVWQQVEEFLGITKSQRLYILYGGGRLSQENKVAIDKKLNEEGIEIKERVISFD